MKHKELSVVASYRPPIVAILGHVDHGKTTLLDTIRKTNVASREHGGITQHIGAYQIKVKSQKSKGKSEEREITFIDTPGHEAFSKMRSRGANVADIAVLVVSADDSVKPQTLESIEQIKNAGVSMIVAVNKIDLQAANVDRVKQDLAKAGVQVEGYGGQVPLVKLSAKQGTGVNDLLEMILLVSDMLELTCELDVSPEAVTIETRVDKGKGMVATVIVKKGTLREGMLLYQDDICVVKVRALFDDQGTRVKDALPSKPIEVLGFTQLPHVGDTLRGKKPEVIALQDSGEHMSQNFLTEERPLPDFLKPVIVEQERLNIILKADTAGSLEAITTSLDKRVNIVGSGIGDITDADILLAKASKSIVVGFSVICKPPVVKLAQTEKVVFRIYTIIYELLRELSEVVTGLKEVLAEERELGKGHIIAEFPFEKQRIAGTKVLSGRLARGDLVKLMRDDTEIVRVKIKSIRHGKDDITKVDVGAECGVLFDKIVDFQVGDGIIAITIG